MKQTSLKLVKGSELRGPGGSVLRSRKCALTCCLGPLVFLAHSYVIIPTRPFVGGVTQFSHAISDHWH